MAPEVKTAKNSKLPKLSENCFEPVGRGGWPPISTWIMLCYLSFTSTHTFLLKFISQNMDAISEIGIVEGV
jgi:hypothetical protein